eukprot:1402577-Pyramimonas_sp.AAC.1
MASESECDVLRHAALYTDIGVGDPSEGLFPPPLLGLPRWRRDAAPDATDASLAGSASEHKARLCRDLIHEHRRNVAHLPDHSEVRHWA